MYEVSEELIMTPMVHDHDYLVVARVGKDWH
jgi:hypothetical protein